MIATDTGTRKKSEPIPPGMKPATCYAAIDRGTHHDEKFDKDKREITLIFEVPSVRIDLERDGQTVSLPRAISKTYTLSLHEKAKLRKDLQSWRGRSFTAEELKGFEVKNIIGKPCLLNLVSSECGKYTNIEGVSPLMEGMEPPAQENPSTYFSFDECADGVEPEWPEGMPDWLVDIAKESDEYRSIIASVDATSSEYATTGAAPEATTTVDESVEAPF